ncbi:hypothetical protein TWF481_000048 [Arthrobotrys musiformis]|uniref:Uncharacterized protein n=1 Tax=Arthrobotrys musiformis TaxID=47236 RepID=A0AAV9WS63_9PEZI
MWKLKALASSSWPTLSQPVAEAHKISRPLKMAGGLPFENQEEAQLKSLNVSPET